MIEKVVVKTAIDSGRVYKDKPIIEISLEDGRKGSAFTNDALSWHGEIELDIKDAGDYKGEKRFYFNLPKQPQQGKFPAKDWTFEKRKCSLELAIQVKEHEIKSHENDGMKYDHKLILQVAELFYGYLNQK